MFCTSLRKKNSWSPSLNGLRTSNWKETALKTHDLAFPAQKPSGSVTYRGVLVTSGEVGTSETKDRIERLQLLNGGKSIFIILLLYGDDTMTLLVKLQMEMLHVTDVAILPILSATDLPVCLNNFRKQCNQNPAGKGVGDEEGSKKLLSHCVNGQPLSERQTNILTDITSGFKDIAQSSLDPQRQTDVCDYLGQEDGNRLISYWADGPKARDW